MSARKSKTPGTAPRPDRPSSAQGHRRPRVHRPAEVRWLFPLLLLATLAAYQPAWNGGMLWDDDFHVTRTELRPVEGLGKIWFSIGATPRSYPVVHSAFWLEHRLWGDQTLGYHLVNITLHALSAFFVALILRRLQIRGAVLAAVIFALHPVHTESVAWMTELKNTLSGAFYLSAALAYLEFDSTRETRRYALAFVLFVLALFSKTVTATLPAALLVVFWWQRGRLDLRKDVVPLVPFFAAGIAGGLTTAWFERTLIGAEGAAFTFTLVERCLIAGRVIWFYLATLVWPANLIFIYPRWTISQAVWWQYLFPLGIVALAGALLTWSRAHSRAPLAALLFFGGTLFPALGFVNVYPFQFSFVADHFQYLASIGVITLASAGAVALADRLQLSAGARTGAVAVVAIVLGLLTWNQAHVYADASTLYRETIARNPDCWMAHNNLGEMLLQGSPEGWPDAMTHFREALRAHPQYPEAHNNLGIGLLRTNATDQAIVEFRAALSDRPAYVGAHANLALALAQGGRLDDAVHAYEDLLRLRPDAATAHANLGVVLVRLGRLQDALPHMREAVHLQPSDSAAHYALGSVLQGLDQTESAVAEYREALRLGAGQDEASIRNDLGSALRRIGRTDDAVAEFRAALRLDPNLVDARESLARIAGATTPAR